MGEKNRADHSQLGQGYGLSTREFSHWAILHSCSRLIYRSRARSGQDCVTSLTIGHFSLQGCPFKCCMKYYLELRIIQIIYTEQLTPVRATT